MQFKYFGRGRNLVKLMLSAWMLLAVAGTASAQNKKYTAIGDSLTVGLYADVAPGPDGTYPHGFAAQFRDELIATRGFSATAYYNRAVSGATSSNTFSPGDANKGVVENQLAAALADAPDLVTLTIGGNDVKNYALVAGAPIDPTDANDPKVVTFRNAFQSGVNTILSQLRSGAPDRFLLLSNVPRLWQLPAVYNLFPGATTEQKQASAQATVGSYINAANTVLASEATTANATLIDLFSDGTVTDESNISPVDGFHPTRIGHNGLAQKFTVAAANVPEAPSLVVTRADDVSANDGETTLREAITYANSRAGAETISFSALFDTPQTISLVTALPNLSEDVAIAGPGANLLTVKCVNLGSFDLVEVDSGVKATLSGLSLINGHKSIDNSGTVAVSNCSLSGNAYFGIYNNGTATVTNCLVSGNDNTGILNFGTVTVTDCTVSGSTRGISNSGTVTATNGTFNGNYSGFVNTQTATLSNCTVSGNTYGISNLGTVTVANCTVSGNSNTGIDTNGGTLMLKNSLVVGNPTNVYRPLEINDSHNITSGSAVTAGLEVDGNGNPLLKDNGGPTKTIALVVANGTAVNAGDNTLLSAGMTTDQRGSGYPRVQGGTVDIGAFESGFVPNQAPINTIPGAQTMAEDTTLTLNGTLSVADPGAGMNPLRVTLIASNGTISLSGVTGLTFTSGASGESSLTFSGTLNAINTALQGLTFTPSANYNGPSSITLNTNDQGTPALSDEDTIPIMVTAVNDAPVANALAVATAEETAVELLLPATDVDGDALSFGIVAPPAHGVLSGNGAQLTYTPGSDFSGSDSFSFKANDGQIDSNTATVTLTVNAVNDAPVAVDDVYAVAGSSPLQVAVPGVLGNDRDNDNSLLSVQLMSTVSHGTLFLVADGGFVYTPQIGYNGLDTFTYRLSDGTLTSNTATVTVSISGNVVPLLALGIAPTSVDENALSIVNRPAVRGRVTRNTAGAALQVNLSSSDTGELRVPPFVTIPDGQNFAEFVLTPVDDEVADGPQRVTISASAPGYAQRQAVVVTVRDNEVATLSVNIVPARIVEGEVTTVVVKRNVEITRSTKALRVSLSALPLRQIILPGTVLPATVTIPAGKAAVSVRVPVIDNTITDGPRLVTFTARATGFVSGSATLVVQDNEAGSNLALGGRITTSRTAGSLPVGGVTLTLKSGARVLDQTVSAANGSYAFHGLPRGTYQIVASKIGVTFAPTARSATLSIAGVSGLNFVAILRPQISGSVQRRNADGTLSGVAGVSMKATKGAQSFTARTDRNGNFLFDRLPLGTFTLTPNLAATSFMPRFRSVSLVAGNAVVSDVMFNTVAVSPRNEVTPRSEQPPAPLSPLALSSATANADSIVLRFSGPLDAASASDAAFYTVEVSGQVQSIEAASCHGDTVTLTLPESTLKAGDDVLVNWTGLRDVRGRKVSGHIMVSGH